MENKKVKLVDFSQLEVLKNNDILIGKPTDFAILMGVNHQCYNDDNACEYWVHFDQLNYPAIISSDEELLLSDMANKNIGIRPCLKYSDFKDKVTKVHNYNDTLKTCFFGEYPQRIIGGIELSTVETMYGLSYANLTKLLCFNENAFNNEDKLDYNYHGIFEMGNEKYVFFYQNSQDDRDLTRKNGTPILKNKGYWFRVDPIKWYIDEEKDIMISEKVLTGGIPYQYESNINQESYNDSVICEYLNNTFIEEILPQPTTRLKR